MTIDHRSNWYLRTSAQRYLPHGLKSWEVTIVDAYSTYTFASPCMQHLCSLQARRLEARWEARDTTEKNEAPQTPPSFFLRPPAALITAPSSERLLVNDSNVLLHGSTRVYGGGSHLSLAHRTACGLTHAVRPRTRPHNLEDVLRLQSEHQRLNLLARVPCKIQPASTALTPTPPRVFAHATSPLTVRQYERVSSPVFVPEPSRTHRSMALQRGLSRAQQLLKVTRTPRLLSERHWSLAE
jgi:hypothetical protein